MSWFAVARALFVIAVAYTAALLEPLPFGLLINIAFALVLAALVIFVETRLRETSATRLLGALLGCAIGLAIARAIGAALFWADSSNRRVEFPHSFVLIMLPYVGAVIGARHGEWLEPARLISLFRAAGPARRYRILDTSVISDVDFADVREVDLKLIELARTLQGKIVTNDFNLNKVAQRRGVEVLNVNELANSLKPVVLSGEIMKVFILKEGKAGVAAQALAQPAVARTPASANS